MIELFLEYKNGILVKYSEISDYFYFHDCKEKFTLGLTYACNHGTFNVFVEEQLKAKHPYTIIKGNEIKDFIYRNLISFNDKKLITR